MKVYKTSFKYGCLFLQFLLFFNCIDEIAIEDGLEFESILIIEATITDELKHHDILLSRTFRLEENEPSPESGAIITVNDGNGNSIEFAEEGQGIYRSLTAFKAQPDLDFRLEITTLDGRSYASNLKRLTPETPISQVSAERSFNENGKEGVSIFVEAINPSDQAKFYRYEYEETYKIIAPMYSPLELEVLNNDFPYPQELLFEYPSIDALIGFFLDLKSREEQEQVCFNTAKSNSILITSTEGLLNSDTNNYRVRFIGRDNPEIMHRYSILVKQYTQSQEANAFYTTLSEFSTSENVFSEVQTGFFEGNIFSTTNPDEKVIGFFEVASYDEKRVYFNFIDLFPDAPLPPYFISCDSTLAPILLEEDFAHNITNSPVIDALNSTTPQIYFGSTGDETFSPFANRPFYLVLRQCGDCTVYGENVVPDFWIEE